MLHIRDISLQKRMMLTNFLMVCIPVVLLVMLGTMIFIGLHVTGTTRQSELALLWPEKGSSMSVSYAIGSLRAKAEKKTPPKLADIFEECLMLEQQGIQVVAVTGGRLLYLTDGADEQAIKQTVQLQCGVMPSAMSWSGNDFACIYTSPYHDTTIWAAGHTSFSGPYDEEDSPLRDFLEFLVFLVLAAAIVLIIWLGLYLARLLSRQVLEPLGNLRKAAAEIKQGNFDYPVNVQAQDELGQTCRDFDDMRRELRAARQRQQKYEQNRKELIAGISHDLATPLTLLKGYASGIREGIARTPEKQRQYIDRIYATACTMEQLVDSLFLFSKLDLGRMPFTRETVPVYRYFEDVVSEMQGPLAEQGLSLSLTGLPTAAADSIGRMKFRRVVANLLTNCLKYKTAPESTVELHIADNGQTVTISCIDHGGGVPKESLSKLFDSFYRTDAARTALKKGSGLGLAIARQVVEGLNGTIWAEETPGGGLTICIALPVQKEDSHETHTHH